MHNRRCFIQTAGVAVGAPLILPRHLIGADGANSKLNIVAIGVGGMGLNYVKSCDSQNIVALCDVDDAHAAKAYKGYPDAKRYRDFRLMFEKEKFDAVIVGTPDHWHAIMAMTAMQMGKHVYCAKPLTRTVGEARALTEMAAKSKVATQMSVQYNAREEHRLVAEWIQDGAIGAVRQVEIWSNRPVWPQGIARPRDTPAVPSTLDWALWQGPAEKRPYHPIYVPFKWRGWWAYGAGALGDMGCHGFDPVYRALKLTVPIWVAGDSTKLFDESAPKACTVVYKYPERGDLPPVTLTWRDGGRKPERPPELDASRNWDKIKAGILYRGEKGAILTTDLGMSPRIIPESRMQEYKRPAKTLSRSIGHYEEWIEAGKGGPAAGAEFAYGGPITEAVLLGNIAVKVPHETLNWDAGKFRFSNSEEANALIHEPMHNGWGLPKA
jgi:predicted dehydrogenase